MITDISSIETLKDAFEELFLATTNNVTKIAPGSVVNATAFGVGKVSQKILKDVAVLESNIFPESAFGTLLDDIARRNGIPDRFGASQSSTFVRVVGDVGTFYDKAIVTFTGKHGVVFELDNDVTIGALGFDYVKVRSTSLAESANVDPLTINQVLPAPPIGHDLVVNEFRATGGRDAEDDDTFRKRIEQGVNILATGTLAQIEQVFLKINNNVLRVYKGGVTTSGAFKLLVSSVNGIDFTTTEFDEMIEQSDEFLSLTEQSSGIVLENVTTFPLDISMRLELIAGADGDATRIAMQISMQKILDLRFYTFQDKIEWDDLLVVAKQAEGVKRILDNFFFVNGARVDIVPPDFTLPRIRSFTLFDVDGVIISDVTGILNPTFFPNQPDFILQQTLLSTV